MEKEEDDIEENDIEEDDFEEDTDFSSGKNPIQYQTRKNRINNFAKPEEDDIEEDDFEENTNFCSGETHSISNVKNRINDFVKQIDEIHQFSSTFVFI